MIIMNIFFLFFQARSVPFDLRFVSDSSEGEFEHHTAAPNNRRGEREGFFNESYNAIFGPGKSCIKWIH